MLASMPFTTVHPVSGAFSPVAPDSWAARTDPLGSHSTPEGTTFAVYSRHASRVLLEIYDRPMTAERRFDYWMVQGSDHIWRACLADVPQGTLYGFRCWGPNWEFSDEWARGGSAAGFVGDVDADGNRFNPNKLLYDPYARELSHDRETPAMQQVHGHHASMYGSGPGLYAGVDDRHPAVARREFDTGPWAPKGLVIAGGLRPARRLGLAQKDAIIYEAHVRGLTRHPSSTRLSAILQGLPGFERVEDVPDELRGTYAGAARMAPYVRALGFTAIELLPVHEFANELNPEESSGWDRRLDEPPHGNYWGYMTYGYFAPDLRYAHDRSPGGPAREFRNMVEAFHDAGVEVYLDVVYNHTGEGGLWDVSGDSAEILSFRGFDNADYYALTPGNRFYWDSTGCGNNLNAATPVVQRLITDSLEYWTREMGVDGFRFDLASVLGRTAPGFAFLGDGALLADIARFAERERVEVIAEAWDLGGYHVGAFPAGWAEWNGAYRDEVRAFLKGDGDAHGFAAAVNGDYHRFGDQGGPHKSVNFITAHDGFTLMDLVSYNAKNNSLSWPFGPSDGGADQNLSWDSDGNRALRRQRLRNFLTVLLCSRGTPMIVSGDEFARTQNGNNNPYKIDSIGIWNNYDMAGSSAPTAVPTGGSGAYHDNYGQEVNRHGGNGLFRFFRFLTQLRASHASLRTDRYGDLALDAGGDVTFWFTAEDGRTGLRERARRLQWRVDGSPVGEDDLLLCVNMDSAAADFELPHPRQESGWVRLIDTAAWAEADGNCWPVDRAEPIASHYRVHGFAIAAFQEVSHAAR
jgi:glycogen operon protein